MSGICLKRIRIMNKREISEIKKQFKKDNNAITRICGCYVDAEKQIKTTLKEAFFALSEEEIFKYYEIFKKSLSGGIGKNPSLPSGETAPWISPSSRKPSLKTAIRSWFSDSIAICRNALRFNILFAPVRACETCRRQLLLYAWQHKKPFYGYLLNSRTFP